MGELIGPERLAKLRAERAQAIEAGKLRHPSNRGRGLEGLIADIRGFSLSEQETIRGLFQDSPEITNVKDLEDE